MPHSNCETWSQLCDELGSNIQYCAAPVLTLNDQITAGHCVYILGNQVHPLVLVLFPNNDAIFQDNDSPIHTARSVQSWFEEHKDALQHLLWPVLESRVISRFPPLSLKQLEEQQQYSIPLDTIQNLHKSVARRIQDVLQANGGPPPY